MPNSVHSLRRERPRRSTTAAYAASRKRSRPSAVKTVRSACDQAVRKARDLMEGAERGKGFGEVAQCGVHAGDECLLERCVEKIREPDAGDELGDDGQIAGRAPFRRVGPGEPWVLEHGQAFDAIADRGLESGQLGADVQPLEHRAGFPVEAQLASPQTIGVAGRRDRDGRFEIRCRHCRRSNDFATRAPAEQFCRTRGNSVIPNTRGPRLISNAREVVERRAGTVRGDRNSVSAIQC